MAKFVTLTGYLVNATRKEIVTYTFRQPSIYSSKFNQLIGYPQSLMVIINGLKAYNSTSWDRNEYVDTSGLDDPERDIKFNLQSYLDKGYVIIGRS